MTKKLIIFSRSTILHVNKKFYKSYLTPCVFQLIQSLFMKRIISFLLLFVFIANSVQSQTNPRHVKVKGYYRKDGTYVRSHYRTAPNSTNRDNFSTRGNVNPYTGKPGYVEPDNRTSSYHQSAYSSTSARRSTTSSYNRSNRTESSRTERLQRTGKYFDGHIYAVTKSNGQLWQTPSQVNVIRAIPQNSFVEVIGYENNFWKVSSSGTTGYIHDVTIKVNHDMIPLKEAYVKRTKNRSTHRRSNTFTHRVNKNTKVKVEYASWSSVRPGNCTMNDRKSLIDYRFVIQTTYLINQPANHGRPVRKMNFGDKVNVICEKDSWYEVAYEGKIGWIEKRFVRK